MSAFRVNPGSQLHSKEPSLLSQFCSQPPLFVSHSLTSAVQHKQSELAYYGGCEQNCDNNEGSFECSCDPGFTLNADMLNCDGMSWNYYNMLAHSVYVELQMSTNVTQTMVVVNRIATTMKALLIAVVIQDLL